MATNPLDPIVLQSIANQQLFEVIHEFLPEAHWDGAVLCDPYPMMAVCGDVWANDEGTIFSLGFMLALGAQQEIVIHDRAAGFGETIEAALRFAAVAFATSIFITGVGYFDAEGHPGHMATAQVRHYPGPASDADGRHRVWQIVSSPALAMSLGLNGGKEAKEPPETLPALEPLLRNLAGAEPRVHWIKVFLSRSDGETTIECALNNQKSPAVDRLFENFMWPRGTDIRYIRQFHILKPTDDFVAAPPVPDGKKSKFRGLFNRKS